jgi:hypothetical protein
MSRERPGKDTNMPDAGIPDELPVLGLFSSETAMQRHLAANLDQIEPGLLLLKSEYSLENSAGAGGRIDLLAKDGFGHVVCIELKRSDRSARETLNELSKYVTLLVQQDRVPREMIRCIVISTHWHELLLPLSYLAVSTGVDITAIKAVAIDGKLAFEAVPLTPLRFLPQLSPDFDRLWFLQDEDRARFIRLIQKRSTHMPFVRMALLRFKTPQVAGGRDPFCLVIAVWRVRPEDAHSIEAVTGKPIGTDFPYVAPGWEAESDAKDWIADVCHPEAPEASLGWSHATSESLRSSLADCRLEGVDRIGDWPRLEFINDDASILGQVLAGSPLRGADRQDRYTFVDRLTPKVRSSWRKSTRAFGDFLGFAPMWRDAIASLLEPLEETDCAVELQARDGRHLMYAIWRALDGTTVTYAFAEAVVIEDGKPVDGVRGGYSWDGRTCPADPVEVLTAVYGSEADAVWAFGSAVDDNRYESALALHGFRPFVARLEQGRWAVEEEAYPIRSIADFVKANPAYVAALANELGKRMIIL